MGARRKLTQPARPSFPLYAWKPERKASRECVAYFIRRALKDKLWAATIDADWESIASDMSREMLKERKTRSVHQLARHALEYTRYRAHLFSGKDFYGPEGWPIDRPASRLWKRLNRSVVEGVSK